MTHLPLAARVAPAPPPATQRIDKWLWCARIFRTRTLATKIVAEGSMRLTRGGDTMRVDKPSCLVRPGDRIAFLVGGRLRVLEVRACGLRRGPAREAALLYVDRSPQPASPLNSGKEAPCSRS
ncbi:RNA-binding S4 domain-containing protein [Amphiplicatus metriothermophilus]|uniref:Heat shock protein Hsp15 n=1 Tax=Amphiplicatus metriothermophilus TaxID=1519374 RepID=A0A239PR95_9PROT|nr:RNA-binding S4 domain-containing protein [Amphiplicatus metriothermophilus]MBB5518605.1 ribosome-associated heat shock protein Hsp15 [Amphiplicatus metriothermophilus]SNT72237.1 heat shock protein Hsp15 [Amphiplicatus metriothermophilus]